MSKRFAALRAMTTLRVQVQTMMKGSYNYSSAWHAVSSIVRQRGLRGMLKGYWAGNSVRHQRLFSSPTTLWALTMYVY